MPFIIPIHCYTIIHGDVFFEHMAMKNSELSERLAALFPTNDIHLRVALVSVMKAVLSDRIYEPNKKFQFSLRGFKHLPIFEVE